MFLINGDNYKNSRKNLSNSNSAEQFILDIKNALDFFQTDHVGQIELHSLNKAEGAENRDTWKRAGSSATTSSLPEWKLYWPAQENHFCVSLLML